MSQQIEIEFKNMLTEVEYKQFLLEFSITQNQIFTQENFYFDTVDFALKKAQCALRIRQKSGAYEMTLKQPEKVGLLETNQILSKAEASLALEQGKLPNGEIQQIIEGLNLPFAQIEYFGSLTTNRVEIGYKEGLLVLDHSTYLGHQDFELEYEVLNYEKGLKIFQQLLREYNIPERRTENKIRRFYEQKYLLQSKPFEI